MTGEGTLIAAPAEGAGQAQEPAQVKTKGQETQHALCGCAPEPRQLAPVSEACAHVAPVDGGKWPFAALAAWLGLVPKQSTTGASRPVPP
jgi:hypothetical protein